MADLHRSVIELPLRQGHTVQVSDRVRRLTAGNPSIFTGPGTNTYLLQDGATVIVDPGPADQAHINGILAACDGRIDYILVTHAHADHSPAAALLAVETGAVCVGLPVTHPHPQLDRTFVPDRVPDDGEILTLGSLRIESLTTPGHLREHLVYRLCGEEILFAGDHVMQGASVAILPDYGGRIADYLRSLRKLQGRGIAQIAPAHGHLLGEADQVFEELYQHRLHRESLVLDAIDKLGRGTTAAIAPLAYPDLPAEYLPISYVALWAHLEHLVELGRVNTFGQRSMPAIASHLWILAESHTH